jgi:hypothetical protein
VSVFLKRDWFVDRHTATPIAHIAHNIRVESTKEAIGQFLLLSGTKVHCFILACDLEKDCLKTEKLVSVLTFLKHYFMIVSLWRIVIRHVFNFHLFCLLAFTDTLTHQKLRVVRCLCVYGQ